jgi:SAM-dependent methyltransferase
MMDILARPETHDWIVDALSKEKRGDLLDVPAGTGALAVRLKDLGFAVSCCDINPSGFQAGGIDIRKGDLNRDLPYAAGAFDYITCLEGLEHLENPFQALAEIFRLLKLGGKLYVSVPNYLNIERRMRFLVTGLFSKIPSPRKLGKDRFDDLAMLHLIPVTYPILKLVLEHRGFEILTVAKDGKKKRMKWLLPLVWAIRAYCSLWASDKREEYHLAETLAPEVIMGGNTLIVVAGKKEAP